METTSLQSYDFIRWLFTHTQVRQPGNPHTSVRGASPPYDNIAIIVDSELDFFKHIGNIAAVARCSSKPHPQMFLVPECSNFYTCLHCWCPPSVRVCFCVWFPYLKRLTLIELNQCSVAPQSGYVSWIMRHTVNRWSLLTYKLQTFKVNNCLWSN